MIESNSFTTHYALGMTTLELLVCEFGLREKSRMKTALAFFRSRPDCSGLVLLSVQKDMNVKLELQGLHCEAGAW